MKDDSFYVLNLTKIITWNFMPFFTSFVLIGVLLLMGFSNSFAFINYLFISLLLYLFIKSIFRKTYWYKKEPCLKIDKWFYLEFIIYGILILTTVIHSALNIRIIISENGIDTKFNYFYISIIIVGLLLIYFFVDYYCSNKNKLRYYLINEKYRTKNSANSGGQENNT